jgi:hypothetical protein
VYETSAGGTLVYMRDPKPYFKQVELSREFGTLDLGVETYAVAPWSQATAVPDMEWRLKAFSGSWRGAVDYYRDWSDQVMKVPAHDQPEWLKHIQVVITVTSPNLDNLDVVAAKLDPTKTLIYLVNWRKDSFDVNYPDYSPNPDTAAFVKRAKELGFKIMLHSNALGVAIYNSAYPALSQYQIKDPETGLPVYWPFELWPGGVPPPDYLPIFAFISPAAAAYRQAWVQALKPSLDALQPDALHVDAGGVMLNDSNGLVEGKTTIEGMVQLNQTLLESYPNLVLSFESMTEFIRPVFGLAQRWNSDFPPHAIGAYFFRDRIHSYGFLAQQDPDDADFIKYIRRYERQNVVPTIGIDQLMREQNLDHPIADLFFKVLALWQQYNFRPDWDGDWQGLGFRFISEDGQTSAMIEDLGNIVRLKVGDQVIYSRAKNTNQLDVGSVDSPSAGTFPANWLGFNPTTLGGLDPNWEYWLQPGLTPADTPHLSNLSSGVKLGLDTKATPDYGYFELERIPPPSFDLIQAFPTAEIGATYYGKDYPLTVNGKVSISETLVGDTLEAPVLFMNPPVGYPGSVVFAEYHSVPIPSQPSFLNFTAAISDFGLRSDGALFVVRVNGADVFKQMVYRGLPVPAHINLAAWAGRSVDIRFIVHPGPSLNPTDDFGVWSDLAIAIDDSAFVPEFDVALPSGSQSPAINGAIQGSPDVSGAAFHATSAVPGKFVVFSHPPAAVDLNGSLLDLPYDVWRVTYDGMPALGVTEVSGSIRPIAAAGVTEPRALATYPPNGGKTQVTWAVQLPPNASQLAFKVGLTDPPPPLVVSYSGVDLAVRVNGETLFTLSTQLAGWKPQVLDISKWAGQNVVIELDVDSDNNASYDWVYWTDLTVN